MASHDKARARTRLRATTWLAGTLVVAALGSFGGCADDESNPAGPSGPGAGGGGEGAAGGGGGAGGAGGDGGGGPTVSLLRPSKSGTIAISDDDSIVAMVNQADDSVSFFTTEDNNRIAKIDTGGALLVLRTPSGRANALAVALDECALPEVVGTLAGDDTILIIARDDSDRAKLRDKLETLAG